MLVKEQIEALINYFEDFITIQSYEDYIKKYQTIISKEKYNYILAKQGLKFLIEHDLIKNLQEVTLDILKTDSILIPANVLEELLNS